MKTSIAIKRLPLIASGVALATCVLAVDRANAAPILLDFEGLGDSQQVLNFYNSVGVSFGDGAQAFISKTAVPAGSGNFINLPSPKTGAFFLSTSGSSFVINVPGGFKDGFSFFYSADATNPPPPTKVRVFDGLNATGTLLAEISLPNNAFIGCGPDADGTFCNWNTNPLGTGSFLGTARSVDFSNVANQIAFDNITLGRSTPCVNQADCAQVKVPEPTSVMGLIAISALGAGSVLQRKLLK